VKYNFFTSRNLPAETGINPIKRPFSSFFSLQNLTGEII